MFDQILSLNKTKTSWRIKVRVTRMWPSVSTSSKGNRGLKGYNLVLLDDDFEDCAWVVLWDAALVDLGWVQNYIAGTLRPYLTSSSAFADVIGMIEEFQGLSDIKTVYGDRNIARSCLTDGRAMVEIIQSGETPVSAKSSNKKIKMYSQKPQYKFGFNLQDKFTVAKHEHCP
ncbi:hypothetical protein DCAR_0101701 [Daucus carota subsp. sativus]|uniref:Uncharacterized protein n=1 Tax=Daucus carota subsp. sativus TaxID=79200 RepID=A0A166GKV3_DAUCS|nr:hypothetical protein DCAR_0101701 [Daucus carota subsp. sativus]